MKSIYSILLKSVVLKLGDMIMRTSVSKFLKEIKVLNNYSNKDLQLWQNKKLQALLLHAFNNTEYYKSLFSEMRIDLKSFPNSVALDIIPELSKKDIRENFEKLISKNLSEIPHQRNSTGGSTGTPLIFLQDKQSWSYATANTIINWERSAYNYGHKYLALGSTSLFINQKKSFAHKIYYILKNKIGVNGINMSNKVCQNYVNIIKRKKIKFIYGYASSIYLLADYVINNNIKLEIKACMPTSEVLTAVYHKTISKAFNCQIINTYGASDGGITAFSVDNDDFRVGYNTIIRFKRIENNRYKILLTDLFNYSMPLINYEIGDEVVLNKVRKTDYNGQIFSEVLGRTSDTIILENGRIITGPGFTILFKDIPVEYYNIEKIDVNKIRCTLKKLPLYNDSHERLILSTFAKQFGEDILFEIEYSDTVYYSDSGKRKYFGN